MSHQYYQFCSWSELLSKYELEQQPLNNNLKVATMVNGLRRNLQQHLQLYDANYYLAAS